MSTTTTTTTMIAPVTRNFPATMECYENSNIPLSMNVTPLVVAPILSSSTTENMITSNQQEYQQEQEQVQQEEPQEQLLLLSLTNIPKCYHCGAPHSSTFTYDRFPIRIQEDEDDQQYQQPYPIDSNYRNHNTYMYYCRLCCKTFTTTLYNNSNNNNTNDNTVQQSQQQQQQEYEKTALQRHMTPKVRNTSTSSSSSTSFTNTTTTGNSNHNSNTTTSKMKPQMEETQLFALPLRIPNTSSSSSSSSVSVPIYRMPAMQCPILWYICFDGGTIATSTNNNNHNTNMEYWKSIATSIQACIETAPAHVHIALMIASQRDVIIDPKNTNKTNASSSSTATSIHGDNTIEQQKLLSIYDLYSPIPKIKCISSDELVCTEQQIIQEILYNAAVPCTTPYIHHIYTALRSLLDYPNTVRQHQQPSQQQSSTTTNTTPPKYNKYRCPIGWVTEVVTTSFQYGAIHVGHRNTTTTNANNNDNNHHQNHRNDHHSNQLVYAGMKLTFLLCDRPTGITNKNKYNNNSNNNNQLPIGERYTYQKQQPQQQNQMRKDTNQKKYYNNNENDPMDQMEYQKVMYDHHRHNEIELTPQQLYNRYNLNHIDPNQLIEYYTDLGRECSDMAIGVDIILFITTTTTTNTNHNSNKIPDFGLSLYQFLSERSGAPPPLIFDLSTIHNVTDDNIDMNNHPSKTMRTRLEYELLSRTPWQIGRVYGAELRVRISPGYVVDPNTVTRIHNIIGPQLAPLYNEAGCIGPASSVNESSQLWRMGTTDQYTSYTFDLTMIPNTITRDQITLDGLDYEINIHPVIQICFAYTTIVSETDEATGVVSYYTVRQMRIANRIVPFAYTVEALLASIDTEALAVVLFHRIALASYQDGIIEASNMTQQWLQCFLVCVYKSAMEQFAIEEQNRQNGIIESNYNLYDKSYRYYYPGERLLFLEGELSAEDVLLAQGHERLRPIVLMVYLLLQCDPFRCSNDHYKPSYDDRCAKLANLSSMTPSSLTRCIAPRIQLWESGMDVMEPIYDVLDLRSDAIQAAILECTSTASNSNGRSPPGLILFLDTPEQIVLMDARYVNNTNNLGSNASNGLRHQSSTKQHNKDDDRLVIGIGLQNAINDAASSYRVRPPIIYELHQSDTNGERTLLRLVDHLIEDTYHVASDSENFNDWRTQIAQDVQM
jgi:hypothetical protein